MAAGASGQQEQQQGRDGGLQFYVELSQDASDIDIEVEGMNDEQMSQSNSIYRYMHNKKILWDSIQITNPFHVSFGLKGNSVGTAASVPKFGYIERKSVAFIDIFSSEV